MTFPTQRTQATLEVRHFLQLLSVAESIEVPGLVQSVALALLRHFPAPADIEASAEILPEIWAAPSDINRIRRHVAVASESMFVR